MNTKLSKIRLDESFVRDRGDGLRDLSNLHNRSGSGLNRLSLKNNRRTVLLGLSTLLLILGDSLQEILSALRVLDMLDTEVDALLQVSVANNLVDKDTNRALGDVENDTSLTVVELVGHTLLNGTIGLNVDNITNLVSLQVGGQRDGTVLLEVTRESVTSTRSVTAARVQKKIYR